MTPEEVAKAILDSEMSQSSKESCLRQTRPAVWIESQEPGDEALPVGSSKLGGLPDGPPGTEWPMVEGRAMAFLCQIDLATVPRHGSPGDGQDAAAWELAASLPESGLLQFFLIHHDMRWGFDPADGDAWEVRVVPTDGDLQPLEPPEELPKGGGFAECAVSFEAKLALPHEELVEGLDSVDEENAYVFLKEEIDYDRKHFLFGHPDTWDVVPSRAMVCKVVASGQRLGGGPADYESDTAKKIFEGPEDWHLLLQLSSDSHPDMNWVDWGTLFFCIADEDLRRGDFSGCWMWLQTS